MIALLRIHVLFDFFLFFLFLVPDGLTFGGKKKVGSGWFGLVGWFIHSSCMLRSPHGRSETVRLSSARRENCIPPKATNKKSFIPFRLRIPPMANEQTSSSLPPPCPAIIAIWRESGSQVKYFHCRMTTQVRSWELAVIGPACDLDLNLAAAELHYSQILIHPSNRTTLAQMSKVSTVMCNVQCVMYKQL